MEYKFAGKYNILLVYLAGTDLLVASHAVEFTSIDRNTADTTTGLF